MSIMSGLGLDDVSLDGDMVNWFRDNQWCLPPQTAEPPVPVRTCGCRSLVLDEDGREVLPRCVGRNHVRRDEAWACPLVGCDYVAPPADKVQSREVCPGCKGDPYAEDAQYKLHLEPGILNNHDEARPGPSVSRIVYRQLIPDKQQSVYCVTDHRGRHSNIGDRYWTSLDDAGTPLTVQDVRAFEMPVVVEARHAVAPWTDTPGKGRITTKMVGAVKRKRLVCEQANGTSLEDPYATKGQKISKIFPPTIQTREAHAQNVPLKKSKKKKSKNRKSHAPEHTTTYPRIRGRNVDHQGNLFYLIQEGSGSEWTWNPWTRVYSLGPQGVRAIEFFDCLYCWQSPFLRKLEYDNEQPEHLRLQAVQAVQAAGDIAKKKRTRSVHVRPVAGPVQAEVYGDQRSTSSNVNLERAQPLGPAEPRPGPRDCNPRQAPPDLDSDARCSKRRCALEKKFNRDRKHFNDYRYDTKQRLSLKNVTN